jgi:hypothetical protein
MSITIRNGDLVKVGDKTYLVKIVLKERIKTSLHNIKDEADVIEIQHLKNALQCNQNTQ